MCLQVMKCTTHIVHMYHSKTNFHFSVITTAVDCGNLADPVNGTVTHLSTTFQSVAQYGCALGYSLINGSATRICQSDGVWSGTQPSCQGNWKPWSTTFANLKYCYMYIVHCMYMYHNIYNGNILMYNYS